jgi:hypothetical protein
MTNAGKPTDAELRARTEALLAEAMQVAKQLRVQTERLASAIMQFQSHTDNFQAEVFEASHDTG